MDAVRRLLLLLLLPAILVTGCGGGGGPAQPAGSTKITATDYRFDPAKVSVTAGKVVFFIDNKGPAAHDMVIARADGRIVARSELVEAGASPVFSVNNLPAGSYTFYCDVPGHRESGMVGSLTSA